MNWTGSRLRQPSRFRLNVASRSDRTRPLILLEGDRFWGSCPESPVTVPEWPVTFSRHARRRPCLACWVKTGKRIIELRTKM